DGRGELEICVRAVRDVRAGGSEQGAVLLRDADAMGEERPLAERAEREQLRDRRAADARLRLLDREARLRAVEMDACAMRARELCPFADEVVAATFEVVQSDPHAHA